MKKMLTALFVLAFALGAAFAASTTGNAKAEIIAPLSVAQTRQMDFGKIVQDATGGNVVLGSNGVATSSLILVGATAAGEFEVLGQPSQNVTVSLPSTISLSDGLSGSMTISSLTMSKSATHALDGTGESVFTVGGTLAVGASQDVGVYTGTYTVTVNY